MSAYGTKRTEALDGGAGDAGSVGDGHRVGGGRLRNTRRQTAASKPLLHAPARERACHDSVSINSACDAPSHTQDVFTRGGVTKITGKRARE